MLTVPSMVPIVSSTTTDIGSKIAGVNSSNSNTNNVTSQDAIDILDKIFAMDAKNVAHRNLLQKEWLDSVMNYNSAEAEKSRDFIREENNINRLLTTELSNSAYSRAIQDLKRNGINPYFAITKGLSSSSPTFSSSSGSAASVSSPSPSQQSDIIGGFTTIFNNLVNNAFSNKKLTVDSITDLTDSFLNFLKPIPTKTK